MRRVLFLVSLVLLLLLSPQRTREQNPNVLIPSGPTLPAVCSPSQQQPLFFLQSAGPAGQLQQCTGVNAWSATTTTDASGNISVSGTGSFGVGGSVAGSVDMTAGTSPAVGMNVFGWGAPTTMTTSVRLVSPNAVPAANQVMLFPAPSASVSAFTWTTFSGRNLTDLGVISGGTTFTMTGCTATTPVGGASAGTYTSGTTGTCTVVITLNGATGLTAPNGWDCAASDRTTPADKQQTTASTTTTVTISGTTVSGDVISFHCQGY